MRRLMVPLAAFSMACSAHDAVAPVNTPVAEGSADLTGVAQGRMAKGTLRILRPFASSCRFQGSCVEASYDLAIANGQQLPVKSPWGVGEWDYDSDAGTWMLATGGITFHVDGSFVFEMTHRAASGATITDFASGLYQIASGSIQLSGGRGDRRIGQIDGNAFTIEWESGLTFAFQKRSH